jgi:adenylate cyclase
MPWKQTIKQSWKGGLSGALLALCLGLGLLPWNLGPLHWDSRLGEHLINLSYDLPFRHRPSLQPPTEVVLVYLDDDSYRNLGQPYDRPWDRSLYARLLDRLTAEKARAVAFDIIFSDPNPEYPEGDAQFAGAISNNGHVILGADYVPAAGGGMTCDRGLPAFSDVAAGWGFVQLATDLDFEVRRHFHVPASKFDDQYSSLSWELAVVSGAPCAQDSQQRLVERWINYYGSPGFIPNISFQLTLDTNGYCPAGFFSNKVVIVGSSLKTPARQNERRDELRTPYTRQSFGPAVDVHATELLNLLRGDWLTRSSARTEVILLVLASLFFGFGLTLFRPLPAVLLAAVGAAVVAAVAQFLFNQQRFWFPWMIIVAAQIPVALLWSVVANSVQLYVRNRLYEQSLRMYLPPKLVRNFATRKGILKPGAHQQVLTMLFSDIADFTSMAEGMDPDHLAALMNAYFQAAVGDCIHKNDGTVVKFIGDAIFAFWNAPEPQMDHAFRACEAALQFRELNQRMINGRILRTRVGLHTGPANVGNFGSADRVDYTAFGQNVNLASRLEGLNKHLGTDRLISARTHENLAGRLVTRPVGSFQLKGFESLIQVHELVGWPHEAEATQPWRDAFAQALANYEERNLELAIMGFRRALELKPNDGPAQFYLKQIEERQKETTSDSWATHTILKEK